MNYTRVPVVPLMDDFYDLLRVRRTTKMAAPSWQDSHMYVTRRPARTGTSMKGGINNNNMRSVVLLCALAPTTHAVLLRPRQQLSSTGLATPLRLHGGAAASPPLEPADAISLSTSGAIGFVTGFIIGKTVNQVFDHAAARRTCCSGQLGLGSQLTASLRHSHPAPGDQVGRQRQHFRHQPVRHIDIGHRRRGQARGRDYQLG